MDDQCVYDLAIIGGGINGCGCAADAALRGLRVFLCDKGNLAAATSSNSSKLIHGGLRYLEYYDFTLVKKALDERQRLLQLAPHLVYPIPFVLPILLEERSPWLIRTGLFLYDHLSLMNQLPSSQRIHRQRQPELFQPLQEKFTDGFHYYDCQTDDARLTLTNALQAKHYGATIRPHTTLMAAKQQSQQWHLTLKSADNRIFDISAKAVINATGPWLGAVANLLNTPLDFQLSLIKGSHIVTRRLYAGNHAYVLQHHDKRVIFVVPFHGYTMIGTTDIAFHNTPESATIDSTEIDYLLTLTNHFFAETLQPTDVIWTWSGVRPLLSHPNKDASALSRDYELQLTTQPAPCLTIYGGKITTYRQLAEKAIDYFQPIFPALKQSLSSVTPLPGGDHFNEFQQIAAQKYAWLEPSILHRYLQSYGTRTELILDHCHHMADLGPHFGATLYGKEVDYLCQEEWASSIHDILWLHSKLGLQLSKIDCQQLELYARI